jgi:tRNA pseudouridine32 synthase/23S rRNA pseudouridine746 synthase
LPVGHWETYEDFLSERFPALSREKWLERMAGGGVLDKMSKPVLPGSPYRPGDILYYYRYLENEPVIPFVETVLYQDEWLVVADKPHFLPVTPSGAYLKETLLVRLKRRLGIDTLSPIHRIDRETAGLVVFAVQPHTRNSYQALFREKKVQKRYEAIAPWHGSIPPALLCETCLEKSDMFMQMRVVEGTPNARTLIFTEEIRGDRARYALFPLTGRKHQLRVQMASLGIPVKNDRIYPVLHPINSEVNSGSGAFANPLQLLSKTLSFDDPVTGVLRHFQSRQTLVL